MMHSILCDRYCPRPIVHATTSMRVNLGSPIGLPFGLGPREAAVGNTSDGQSQNGVVFLPRGGQQVDLTFSVPPNYDLYPDRITCQLWSIAGVAPNRTLAFVQPNDSDGASTTPVDVRLEIYDAGRQTNWQDSPIHWAELAGDGRHRFGLPVPNCMRGGRTYKVIARNNETDRDFMISFVFWGRKVRTQQPTGGWTQNDTEIYGELMRQLKEQGHLSRGWLSPDIEDVIERTGLYTCQGLNTDDTQPLLLQAGTFDAPFRANARIFSGADVCYMVAQLMGRQFIPGQNQMIQGNIRAVFVQVFDQQQQYWMTNVPVPMMALVGDGRQPHLLDVEWSWGFNANMNFDFWKMDAGDLRVNIDTEGWFRRYHDMLCPR